MIITVRSARDWTALTAQCYVLLGPRPLRCTSTCQIAMSKARLQADPITNIVLDLKSWKLGQLLEEAMGSILAEWDV